MSEHPKPCHWVDSEHPRVLKTHLRDCILSGCDGCEPCPERHCGSCGVKHVERLTCPGCVGAVREDLETIGHLFATSNDDQGRTNAGRMIEEATHHGINSQAAMLAGPSADTSVAMYRRKCRCRPAWSCPDMQPRIGPTCGEKCGHPSCRWLDGWARRCPTHVAWEADNRDELHPLYVLGTWDLLVTAHYGHNTRTQRITVESAVHYLSANLTELAQDPEFAFEELAREIRGCRGHLEDVLQEGDRDEKGAPCPMCGTANLVKVTDEKQTERCDCGPRPRIRHTDHASCTCPFRLRIEQPNPEKDPVAVRIYDEPPLPVGHAHPRDDLACIACHREAEWDARHAEHGGQADDEWACPKRDCGASYTEHDYRIKVEAVYVMHAERLTASQISATYRVPEGTIRQWALRDKVRKHGTDSQGRMLYDVADVINARDSIPA